MVVDEQLANRIRTTLKRKEVAFVEKRMFGGLGFMVRGNMCVGIMKTGEFMVRVGKERHEEVVKRPYAKVMNFTGRPMKGFVEIKVEGIESEADLEEWIGLGLVFNKMLPEK